MTPTQAKATLLKAARLKVIRLMKAQGLKLSEYTQKDLDKAALTMVTMEYADKLGYRLVLKRKAK